MIKTKLPTGLVYGLDKLGTFQPTSDVYHEEWLHEKVIVYSYDDPENFVEHFSKHHPDVIITTGKYTEKLRHILDKHYPKTETYVRSRWFVYEDQPINDTMLANDIVCKSVFTTCAQPFDVYGNKEIRGTDDERRAIAAAKGSANNSNIFSKIVNN